MIMKRNVGVLAIFAMVAVLLTGCWAGEVYSTLTITSEAGAGTKVVYIEVLKDHVQKPDNNGTVDDNSQYFPNGMQAVADWLKENVPAGFTVELKETEDMHVYSISYSFTDIADYNAKTKQLIGEERWNANGLQEATLSVADGKVTFTEDAAVTMQSALAYIEQVYNQPDLYDSTKGGTAGALTLDQIYSMKNITVKVGGTEQTFELAEGTQLSVTGAIGAASANTGGASAGAVAENPATGDAVLQYGILALASAALFAFAWAFRRKSGRAS
jgi:hypothetical protein